MAIARVNQGTSGLGATGSATSGTTVTVTLSQEAVAGSMLVCMFSNGSGGSPTVDSISGGGVTWVLAGSSKTTNNYAEIWYGLNSSGVGTSVVLTLTGTTGATARATIAEFSGVATSSALDAGGTGASGNDVTPTTATITPTSGLNEVIFATFKGGNASAGPTNSFTALNSLSVSFGCAYLLVASTTGTYNTAWTIASTTWNTEIASFKAAVAAPPATNTTNFFQLL